MMHKELIAKEPLFTCALSLALHRVECIESKWENASAKLLQLMMNDLMMILHVCPEKEGIFSASKTICQYNKQH